MWWQDTMQVFVFIFHCIWQYDGASVDFTFISDCFRTQRLEYKGGLKVGQQINSVHSFLYLVCFVWNSQFHAAAVFDKIKMKSKKYVGNVPTSKCTNDLIRITFKAQQFFGELESLMTGWKSTRVIINGNWKLKIVKEQLCNIWNRVTVFVMDRYMQLMPNHVIYLQPVRNQWQISRPTKTENKWSSSHCVMHFSPLEHGHALKTEHNHWDAVSKMHQ